VENGAAKDLASNNGATPWLLAAGRGHLDIVRFLRENGADQADSTGATYDPMTQSCFFVLLGECDDVLQTFKHCDLMSG
jgi:ankyrin repeat protein